MKTVLLYAAGWLGLAALAIANGAIREKTYGKALSELRAHQLSTVTGMLLFGVFIWLLVEMWPMASPRQAMVIGGLWLVMTILFEFVFGHFVMGHSWGKLLYDYNLYQGRIWVLVLLWTATAPLLFYHLRP